MKNWEADIQSFMSDALLGVGKLNDAWDSAMRAHVAYKRFGDRIGGAESAWGLGDIAVEMQKCEDAERWYREAANQAVLANDPSSKLESYLRLGRFLMNCSRNSEAMFYLSEAKEIATNLNENSMLEEIQQLLR